jgi:hypothetical protein
MRDLLRAGASAVTVLAIMLGAGFVLWIGVPLATLYAAAQVQGATGSLGAALGAGFVTLIVAVVLVGAALGWLNHEHMRLREARGLEPGRTTALEAVMVISAAIALTGFVLWFLVIEGPGPMLAPRN